MSALSTLFTDIYTTLTSNFSGYYIDTDLGQLSKNNRNNSLSYPAILIKLVNVSWKDSEDGKFLGIVHVRLKMIFQLEGVDDTDLVYYRSEMGDVLEIVQNLHTAIDSLSPSVYSTMVRINENQGPTLENNTITYNVDYMTNIKSDNSTLDAVTVIDYNKINDFNTAFLLAIDANRI